MSYVLELQNLSAESGAGPDSPSTVSIIGCASTWSVFICFAEQA